MERFQLSVFLFIIATRNLVELSGVSDFSDILTAFDPMAWDFATQPFSKLISSLIIARDVLLPVSIIFSCEMLVDWIKHAFITKFNHIRPDIYEKFCAVLANDLFRKPSTYANESEEQNVNGTQCRKNVSVMVMRLVF